MENTLSSLYVYMKSQDKNRCCNRCDILEYIFKYIFKKRYRVTHLQLGSRLKMSVYFWSTNKR